MRVTNIKRNFVSIGTHILNDILERIHELLTAIDNIMWVKRIIVDSCY